METVKKYYEKFDGEKGVAGFSERGEKIFYFSVSKTDFPVVIVQSAIHAREYITAYLSLFLAEDFKKRGKHGKVYFLPLVNPDGVKIALEKDPLYKANGRGVDLNVNFDAGFKTGAKNVSAAGSENYTGEFPFSERETRTLRDFTLSVMPSATISFHSKGEEIYYGFNGKREEDKEAAELLGRSAGYAVLHSENSAGGYKDWCVDKLGIPAFTVEIGRDELSHPLGKKELKDVIEKNRDAVMLLTEYLWKKSLWRRL